MLDFEKNKQFDRGLQNVTCLYHNLTLSVVASRVMTISHSNMYYVTCNKFRAAGKLIA